MKIVILTSMFPPKWLGGVEIATQNIARYLAQAGHEVHVITSLDKELPKESQEDNFFVHRINYPKIKILGSLIFWLKIFFNIKKNKPDIVHCQRIQMGAPGLLFKKIYKKPYIVWCHGDDIYFPWKFKKIISRLVLNSAGAVIALTNDMRDRLGKSFKRNIFILPNGISPEKFKGFSKQAIRDKFKIRPDEKIIIFVGGLKSIKGVRYLIEAFKIINQKIPETRLFLVGDGSERHNLEDIVKKNRLQEKVNFLGKIINEKVSEYMAASDIFVLPSLFETFGIVNLEAMASGLPVVATRVYGIPEVIKDGENGFLVDPKSPEQLAEKILFLFKNDELREKISENNKEKAKKYSWENIVAKLEKIYSEVINENNQYN